MKAFLIDPTTEALDKQIILKEVDYSGDYREIYDFIDCRTFDVARFNDQGDGLFIDDEGLINGPVDGWIIIRGYPQKLAGKGLILGCDAEGNSVAPTVTREWLEENMVVSDGLFCFNHRGEVVGLDPTL